MSSEVHLVLFGAGIGILLTMTALFLCRSLAPRRVRKKRPPRKTSPVTELDYLTAGQQRSMLDSDLSVAVRYHFWRLCVRPNRTQEASARSGCLRIKPLNYRATCGTWGARLEEQVRHHFYKQWSATESKVKPLEPDQYKELEEQVKYHFNRLHTGQETNHKSAGKWRGRHTCGSRRV